MSSLDRFGGPLRGSMILSCFLLVSACSPVPEEPVAEPAAEAGAGLAPVWEATAGVDAPESAFADPETGDIFVSQIIGDPTTPDGAGRIVRLSGSGEVLDEAWA